MEPTRRDFLQNSIALAGVTGLALEETVAGRNSVDKRDATDPEPPGSD